MAQGRNNLRFVHFVHCVLPSIEPLLQRANGELANLADRGDPGCASISRRRSVCGAMPRKFIDSTTAEVRTLFP